MGAPIVVLLIDDQPFVAAAIRQLLTAEPDIELHYCQHPLDAISTANRIAPDVILQDLVMPGMDGATLVDAFRHNAATATTPVVVLSGSEDGELRDRAMARGASGFLLKVPPQDALVGAIRRHAAGDAAIGAPAADASAAAAVTLDRSVLAAFEGAGDPAALAFTRMVIDQFLDEAGAHVAQLSAGAADADGVALQQVAHRLKGSAATIGARTLAALCGQMERHAGRGARGGVIAVLLTEIEKELAQVRDALDAERRRRDQR